MRCRENGPYSSFFEGKQTSGLSPKFRYVRDESRKLVRTYKSILRKEDEIMKYAIVLTHNGPKCNILNKRKLSKEDMLKLIMMSDVPYIIDDVMTFRYGIQHVCVPLRPIEIERILLDRDERYSYFDRNKEGYEIVRLNTSRKNFKINLSEKYCVQVQAITKQYDELVHRCISVIRRELEDEYDRNHPNCNDSTKSMDNMTEEYKEMITRMKSLNIHKLNINKECIFKPATKKVAKMMEAYNRTLEKRAIMQLIAENEERKRVAQEKEYQKRVIDQTIERYDDDIDDEAFDSLQEDGLFDIDFNALMKVYKKRSIPLPSINKSYGNSCVFESRFASRYTGYASSGRTHYGGIVHENSNSFENIVKFLEDGLYDEE